MFLNIEKYGLTELFTFGLGWSANSANNITSNEATVEIFQSFDLKVNF